MARGKEFGGGYCVVSRGGGVLRMPAVDLSSDAVRFLQRRELAEVWGVWGGVSQSARSPGLSPSRLLGACRGGDCVFPVLHISFRGVEIFCRDSSSSSGCCVELTGIASVCVERQEGGAGGGGGGGRGAFVVMCSSLSSSVGSRLWRSRCAVPEGFSFLCPPNARLVVLICCWYRGGGGA